MKKGKPRTTSAPLLLLIKLSSVSVVGTTKLPRAMTAIRTMTKKAMMMTTQRLCHTLMWTQTASQNQAPSHALKAPKTNTEA